MEDPALVDDVVLLELSSKFENPLFVELELLDDIVFVEDCDLREPVRRFEKPLVELL